MRIDSSDTSLLAERLRVGPIEMLKALGGPWYVADRGPLADRDVPGTLFVGRAGPSVAVLVEGSPSTAVRVGGAVGSWPEPGSLEWAPGAHVRTITRPGPEAPVDHVDEFLAEMGAAVDEAAREMAPRLVTCRYCGMVVAAAFSVGAETCEDCGARLFGVRPAVDASPA